MKKKRREFPAKQKVWKEERIPPLTSNENRLRQIFNKYLIEIEKTISNRS